MKKLMIAAAIVCAAAISQAASVTWTSSALAYDSTGTQITTSGVPADGQLVLIYLGNGSVDWDNFKAENVVSTASDYTYANDKGETYTVTGTFYLDNTKNFNGDIFTVGLLKDGDVTKLLDYAGQVELEPTYTLAWDGNDSAQGIAAFEYASSAYQFQTAAVPEPTSAMLLVLGLGALALRRRRA